MDVFALRWAATAAFIGAVVALVLSLASVAWSAALAALVLMLVSGLAAGLLWGRELDARDRARLTAAKGPEPYTAPPPVSDY